jgi:hypothetical protein
MPDMIFEKWDAKVAFPSLNFSEYNQQDYPLELIQNGSDNLD